MTPIRYKQITPKRPLTTLEMGKLDSEADRWINHGVPLVSINWDKKPCKGSWKKRKGKPLGQPYENITRNILNLDATGIGLICGPTSGIVGVGCDDMKGAQQLDLDLRAAGIIPVSYTSGKGIHYLFKNDNRLPHTCGTILHRYGEVDIRSKDLGYLVLPGSLHDSGKFYSWVNLPYRKHVYVAAHELKEQLSFPTIPEWLVQAICHGRKTENSGVIAERKALKDSTDKPYDWGKPIEVNDRPVFNTGDPLPPKILKGVYKSLFLMDLPRSRWAKFSKHPAAIKWLTSGVILEGDRFQAERSIGSLAATCYANKEIAISLLESFRFIYIPVRRSKAEEIQLNRDIEELCSKRHAEQKDRDYDSNAPDKKLFPKEHGRYWFNKQARHNSMQPLIDNLVENKLFHPLYQDHVSVTNFVIFLMSNFRYHLIYECVRDNSKLHTILNQVLGVSTSTSNNTSNINKNVKQATTEKWLGTGRKFKNIKDLMVMDVGGRLSQKEKDLRSEAKLYNRDRMLAKRKAKAEATKTTPVHSRPLPAPGMVQSTSTMESTLIGTSRSGLKKFTDLSCKVLDPVVVSHSTSITSTETGT